MGDDIDDQGTPDVEITGQHMSAAPASQANSSTSSNSKSDSSKGGRPRDPVMEHVDESGPVNKKKRRSPVQCKHSKQAFTASQAETATLRQHILFKCKQVAPEVRQQLEAHLAKQVAAEPAAASAATVTAGVQRKKQKQLQIGRYAAGSVENQLHPEQIKQAEQHLLRSIVCNNLSFRWTDCPHFAQFCQTLRPGYIPPCPTAVRTRLLVSEYSFCLQELSKRLQAASNLTVSADGWTDLLRRSILGITVVFPDGSAHLLAAVEHSAESHTAENIAQHIIQVLQWHNVTARVALLVTDNAAAMAAARCIVVGTPGLQHVIPFRCYMHAFALLLGSIMSHSWATDLVSKAQKVVTYFRASHKPMALFREAQAKLPGQHKALASSNTTRLTSVQLAESSVLHNHATFSSILNEPGGKEAITNAGVLQLLQDLHFFGDLGLLDAVLEPISWVIMAVQRKTATMADVARYWHFLARKLGAAVSALTDIDFAQHVINAFHVRAKEMDVPLLKLALFLDPKYRQAALQQAAPSVSNSSAPVPLAKLQHEAGVLAQRLGYSEGEVTAVFDAMERYAYNLEPFNKQETQPRQYWVAVNATAQPGSSAGGEGQAAGLSGAQLLANIAQKLQDVKPTAATPEQVFSRMGWFHSKHRNQLGSATNEMETTIKMHWERFAAPKISSNQQAKRDKFDGSVASAVEGSAMSAAAQLPEGLLAHVAANRGAAEAAGRADADGSAVGEDAVIATELANELSRLREALRPPDGHRSWTEAVMDVFQGWDLSSDLLSQSYKEVIQAPAVEVRPPTTGQFSVQNLLQQRQALQPQQILQQQLQQQQLQQGSVMGAQQQLMGLPMQQFLQQQQALQLQQQQQALQQHFAQVFTQH